MTLGSFDPEGGGPGRSSTWVAIVAIVVTFVLPAFSAAEFIFAQRLVLIVGCALAAAVLLYVRFLESSRLSWSVASRRASVGIAIVLAGVASLLGYGELTNEPTGSGPKAAKPFDVPGRPVKGVVDPTNRNLLLGDRGGLVRAFDIETKLPIGRPQRIGDSIGDLVVRRGFLYATVNEGELTRVQVGPARGRPIAVRYGTEDGEIAVGDGSIWVNDRAGGRVLRFGFDLELIASIPLGARRGAQATSLAFSGSRLLWVTDSGLNAIHRIDPKTNEVVVSKSVLRNPSALQIAGNVVYVAHPGIRTLVRHDGLTGKQIPGLTRIGSGPTTLTVTTGRLYICNVQSDQVQQLSLDSGMRTGAVLATGLSPTDLIVGPGGKEMWVTNSGSGTVTPIEIGQ